MAILAGTTTVDTLNTQAGVNVGGTLGVVGASTFAGAATFSGSVTFSGGVNSAVTLFTAAGTVTAPSQIVVFNVAAAGFAVQLPAPGTGKGYTIINQIAPTSGSNTITIPSGGTIYQGTSSGTVLTFATLGQTARLDGISSTQYRVTYNMGSPTLS